MPETRVLVIANSLLVRTGLAALLGDMPDLHIIGQTTSPDDLDIYRPDVIVYDLSPDLTLLGLIVEAQLPLIVLMGDENNINLVLPILMELERGYGVLLREAAPGVLNSAILAAVDGLATFDPLLIPMIAPQVVASSQEPLTDPLTPREAQVLQLLAQGLANKAIAQQLGISPNTVKFHINALFSKLSAQSRTEAVVRATQLGLIVM